MPGILRMSRIMIATPLLIARRQKSVPGGCIEDSMEQTVEAIGIADGRDPDPHVLVWLAQSLLPQAEQDLSCLLGFSLGAAFGLSLGFALRQDALVDGRFLDPLDAQDHGRDLPYQLLHALFGMV